ncbi:MAG: quinol:cytochrome C oxidoreductase [Acidobacteria bacterium]|nr:quinol:cytochrome C oxidoreductase [Acidobacteriota bacterium]
MRTTDISIDRHELGGLAPLLLKLAGASLVAGVAGIALMATVGGRGLDRILQSWLVGFTFFLNLSLGALFFVLLHHLTRAGWSVVVRRLAEGMAALFPLLALLAVPIVLWLPRLYRWAEPGVVVHDPILAGKAGWLDPTFFTIRLGVYLLIWSVLGLYLFSRSVRQDATGDPRLTVTMEKRSAPGMVLFALAVNFCAFDLLMSLDPHWFSTIFGVYLFAGSVVVFFAVLPHLTHWLQHHEELLHTVTVEHFHDMGKMLFAFVVFWAYIAFSQYMLIWYANLPEETEWFLRRQSGQWVWFSLFLAIGHFVIPFILLLPRSSKRKIHRLLLVSAWMVLLHWVDIYWIVMPELSPGRVPLDPLDLFVMLTMAGAYGTAWVLLLRRRSLVPARDPRLAESLAFENA